jgi:hypothetical protein
MNILNFGQVAEIAQYSVGRERIRRAPVEKHAKFTERLCAMQTGWQDRREK